MVNDTIEGILKYILRFLLEYVLFYTGEIILMILTLGRKKPRWDYYKDASPAKFVFFSGSSIWLGFFFWIFTIGSIARLLIR